MLVSFGGAEEWPGVMFTCSMRSRAPFSETETLWKRTRDHTPELLPPLHLLGPLAYLHGRLLG